MIVAATCCHIVPLGRNRMAQPVAVSGYEGESKNGKLLSCYCFFEEPSAGWPEACLKKIIGSWPYHDHRSSALSERGSHGHQRAACVVTPRSCKPGGWVWPVAESRH